MAARTPFQKAPIRMTTYHLALLGFGNVGRALARLLLTKTAEVRARYGVDYTITGLAARRLGWQSIPARIAPLDALRAELAEIDENLIRQELTALEEAEHLQRRVEILEALGERAQASPGTNQYTPR